ncbi:MAG TPA: hypothetical protein DD640_02355 [Clostridiales bacterium]|nr:hypothetical protein [Clostridiales bacterium]
MAGKIKKPEIAGDYVHIYRPVGDIYPGPESRCFMTGKTYDIWVPNDFTVIRGPDDRWHLIGITHPAPPDYVPPDDFCAQTIHDAEWLLFHAASEPGNLRDALQPDSWKDKGKLLHPALRPGEPREIYAPHIICANGLYYMIYGPDPMRIAVSGDLYCWRPAGELFRGHSSSRDPNVILYQDRFWMTYVSENKLLGRSSEDLYHWSEPVEVFHMDRPGVPESPCIIQREDRFYLFWCIYDGRNGPYDNRTFVYYADTPCRFEPGNLLTQLEAHAPEVVCGEDGETYVFSVERPHRGVSVARLSWL